MLRISRTIPLLTTVFLALKATLISERYDYILKKEQGFCQPREEFKCLLSSTEWNSDSNGCEAKKYNLRDECQAICEKYDWCNFYGRHHKKIGGKNTCWLFNTCEDTTSSKYQIYEKTVKIQRSLKESKTVFNLNVYHVNMWKTYEFESRMKALERIVKQYQPDIIGFNELIAPYTPGMMGVGGENEVERIQNKLEKYGFYYSYYAPAASHKYCDGKSVVEEHYKSKTETFKIKCSEYPFGFSMGNGFVSKHPMRKFSKTLDVWDPDYSESVEHINSGTCSSDNSAENYKLLSGYSEKDVFVKNPYIKNQGVLQNEGYSGTNIGSLKDCRISCESNKFCNFYSWFKTSCYHSYSCHVTKKIQYSDSQPVVYQLRRKGSVVASALLEIQGNKILLSETHVNMKWGKENLKMEANKQIIAIHEELRTTLQPNLALIMGDFNHYSWNKTLQKTYFANNYNDALHLYHDYPSKEDVPAFYTDRQQQSVFGKFEADDPCQLDYVFLHEDHHEYLTFAAVVGAFGQEYEDAVSDHLGVFTRYRLSRQNPRRV